MRDGKPAESVALAEGVTTVGRDPTNLIPLHDQSVSRRHAEIECAGDEVRVRDLDSRNGIRVNGVPRKQAVLQPGDIIEMGVFTFQIHAGPGEPLTRTSLANGLLEIDNVEKTERYRLQLPSLGGERRLSTLCHVCAWLAEDLEAEAFTENCLRLLLEGMNAAEAQFYNAGRELEKWVSNDGAKPRIRLADFLAERFQNSTEAVVIPGREAQRHQQHVGKFNYLVGPLRPLNTASGAFPFVLLIRPSDWADFGAQDRVLLQTICQLWVRTLNRARTMEALRTENAALKQPTVPALLGQSEALEKLRQQAIKAARTKATISVLGETGSGKEVVAHFIHAHSPRADRPFIKVNCAAIPDGLIESELFGHVKGAFTDARADRRGKFEQADGGTLFLDEIGEMPLSVQSKVLRAIENGEIEKLGDEKVLHVDVRLVAASHRDLPQMVRARQFREDLYYRLSVVSVRVPPLREHLDDIEVLAGKFLEQFCMENGLAALTFEAKAIAELKRHSWPGNVRELRNVIHRCAGETEAAFISARLVREQMRNPGS